MPEPTIAASGVRALLGLAVSRGAGRQALMERARLDPAELDDPDNRIGFSKYVALMRAGQELCRDPALALHFGEVVDATEVSILHSFGGFTTIDEVLVQVNRYAPLGVEVEGVAGDDRYLLSRRRGQLWIVDARRNPNDFPELTESSFARMVCSTRRTLGEIPAFKEIHVTHDEPAYAAEYQRIFRVPVTFRSDQNALRLDEGLMAGMKFPPPPRYVSEVMRDHADALLEKLDHSRTTRGRVEGLLKPLLPRGGVSMDEISRALGLSRPTLFRRLKAEGITFEQVVDELRYQLARHYLSATKASVKETAHLVGYSDPAAFSRAFKRWTGHSPRIMARDSATPSPSGRRAAPRPGGAR